MYPFTECNNQKSTSTLPPKNSSLEMILYDLLYFFLAFFKFTLHFLSFFSVTAEIIFVFTIVAKIQIDEMER